MEMDAFQAKTSGLFVSLNMSIMVEAGKLVQVLFFLYFLLLITLFLCSRTVGVSLRRLLILISECPQGAAP